MQSWIFSNSLIIPTSKLPQTLADVNDTCAQEINWSKWPNQHNGAICTNDQTGKRESSDVN